LLSKSMKQYVLNKEKIGYNKETQNTYNNRLRDYAIQAIKDLTLLANKLPEAQQDQIFTDNTMRQLFRSLFNLLNCNAANQAKTIEDLDKVMDEEQMQKRRSRILLLCYEAVNEIGSRGSYLAPYEMSILLQGGQSNSLPVLTGTNAVYLKAFSLHQLPPKA